MKHWILAFIVLICIPLVAANSGSMKLLAVTQTSEGMEGTIAKLSATLSTGEGRVFIDSFPLSKIDTQISTRFAKEVACHYLRVDCTKLDFFYIIRAKSSIIGGPSAGAALAVLTVSLLENSKLREDVAITGTINSGGFIGPVGGLPEKLKAAAQNGIKLVLIPPTPEIINESNKSVNISQLAGELGIELREVVHLSEALAYFKGKQPAKPKGEIKVKPVYKRTMKMLAVTLCNRTRMLLSKAERLRVNKSELKFVHNLTVKAQLALNKGKFYSGASFCFGANARLSQVIVMQNLTKAEVSLGLLSLKEAIQEFKAKLPEYRTLTDLESFTVVVERLSEASDYINSSLEALKQNNTSAAASGLGYAKERFYSAKAWAKFFGSSKVLAKFEPEKLKEPCLQKIMEAKERVDYLKVYIPNTFLGGLSSDLKEAVSFYESGEYELCLFKASKVKAQADSVLNSMSTTKEGLREVLDEMLGFIKLNIIEQTEKGHFPIVGYSYYEYAQSLKDTNVVSAYVYAQYALELSNLDMYFPQQKAKNAVHVLNYLDIGLLEIFITGLAIGILLGYGITRMIMKTHPGPRGTRSGKKR